MINGLNMPPKYDNTTPQEETQQPQPIDTTLLQPTDAPAMNWASA